MKTLIFDFDGTLCDTCGMIVDAMQYVVTQQGFPTPTPDECRATIGLPADDCFAALTGLDAEGSHRCTMLYDSIEMASEERLRLVKPFPGVKECLTKLKEQGYEMTIATSRRDFSVRKMLDMYEMRDFFSIILAPEQVKHGKPAPDLALKIMEMTGSTPEETLVIGDSHFDIQMGRNAGCHTCAVTFGNGTRAELESAQADFLVDNFQQLIDWLEKNSVTQI